MLIAALAAAAVSAEFVGGKATRDALFLTTLEITALPAMLVATSVCSIVLAAIYGRGARRIAPAVLVPVFSVVSGALFLVEWFFESRAPLPTAVAVYLHISVVVPILASGFWLIATERFDPRSRQTAVWPHCCRGDARRTRGRIDFRTTRHAARRSGDAPVPRRLSVRVRRSRPGACGQRSRGASCAGVE